VKDEEPHSLANISLRWMLHEIHRSESGIVFDYHALQNLGIPADCLPPASTQQDHHAHGLQSIVSVPAPDPDNTSPLSASSSSSQPKASQKTRGSASTGFASLLHTLKGNPSPKAKETLADQAAKSCSALDAIDVLEPNHDQLVANPLWWLFTDPEVVAWRPLVRVLT
jgi:hypothetical protein